MKILRIFFGVLLVLFLVPFGGLLGIYLNYHLINLITYNKVYSDVDSLNYHKYTLVFGTGDYEPEHWTNHALLHRMSCVADLVKNHKTSYIIASGIKTERSDEAGDMKIVLTEMGVDPSIILIDTLGTRTWESIINAKNRYPGQDLILVSQKEHLERALFIAGCTGVDAVGLKADPVPYKHRYWTYREYLARVKSTIDCLRYKFTPEN